MDDEALDSTAAVSDITVEGSVSKISDRNRLLAIAGEEEPPVCEPKKTAENLARWAGSADDACRRHDRICPNFH